MFLLRASLSETSGIDIDLCFILFNLFYTVVFSVAQFLFKLYIYNDTAFIMIPTYFIFISIVYCIYMF